MAETFYDVLGVSPDAHEDAIDDAYRDRIKETHPDVSDAADAQERTRKVIEAKDVLTDPDERARYDDLGHDSYVRQTTTDADWGTDGSASGASTSTAARQAAETDWSESSGEGTTWAGRGDWRDEEAAQERRRRERRRRAREAAGVSGARADGSTVDGGAPTDGGATSNVGGPVGWATSSRHAVRNDQTRSGVHRSRLFPPGQSLVLLISAFICYPALVFSSLFPSFPLIVNLIVGACTLILVAYLTSMPEVGIYVFGAWTALGTFGLIATAVNPLSPVGLVVLLSTWFPFGLTVLTYEVLRW
jgi:curved DNA-binding protein CbpA